MSKPKRPLKPEIRAMLEAVKAKPSADILAGARRLRAQQCALQRITKAQAAFVASALRRDDALAAKDGAP